MRIRSVPRMRTTLPSVVLAAILLASTGCVRRTVTINTDPQGATVTLNDHEVGTSPARVDFTWYGDYDVIIRKEGYTTLRTHKKLNAPWYQITPIDLIAEAFVPFTIHDQQEMFFALTPHQETPRDELVKSAVEFKEKTLFGND